MIHAKKVRPEYFAALRDGSKLFELRRIDAREPAYCKGDYLALNEFDERYTGRCMLYEIVYVLPAEQSCGTLAEGCVALGLRPMPLSAEDLQALRRK